MLEFIILSDTLERIAHIRGDRFEFEGNLYSRSAIEARYKELFAEFIEPYTVAQNVEVVDITEKSE